MDPHIDKAEMDQLEEKLRVANRELDDYRRENARYAEALQQIADGKGKYAGIAKEAL